GFPVGEHDRSYRGDEQEDGGGLEGDEELFEQEVADRGGVAEAGGDVGTVGAEGLEGGGEDGGGDLDEEEEGQQPGEQSLAGNRVPLRLVGAADVGDDEDVEHHHRARVDDHLGGGDEGRGQEQKKHRQRE